MRKLVLLSTTLLFGLLTASATVTPYAWYQLGEKDQILPYGWQLDSGPNNILFGPDAFFDNRVSCIAGAQVITTSNLKHFVPLPAGIEAQSPDEFLCNLYDLDPLVVMDLLREQAADLVNPPVTFEEVLERLSRVVPDLVAAVRQRVETTGAR